MEVPMRAIEVTDLHFSYGEVRAVDGVSLAVAPGEILGVLGPNGAGKSTTIKMIIGQLRPASGEIRILGLPMPAKRDEIQSRLGVCFEEKNLYSAMSAEENLRFFAKLFGIRNLDTASLLERVDLAARAKDRVSGFSKGMRQRLMMARALVNQPDVLILDEPTDGLDPVSAIKVRELVLQEARRGAAVLLTTHDMHEADELSDRVAFINAGKVLVEDTPEALKLKHGTRSLTIRTRGGDGVRQEVIAMDEPGAADRVTAAMADPNLLTLHSAEATLEDVFVEYAGRGLA
jgi:ABC-type multidrug transport system ATPase subunit